MNERVGDSLKRLSKGTITRELLQQYAEASGDKNPLHLDDSFAKQVGFPSVIAHGMLSMAFMADHVLMNFPESQYRLLRLKIRFRKVTLPGDEITCGGSIKKISPEGKVTLALWTRNQAGEDTTDGEAEVVGGVGADEGIHK